MKVTKTKIPDVLVINPDIFEDGRGFFVETWQKKKFEDIGINYNFVQDNHSKSKKNVLRGLHYQKNNPQGKLVRCIKGKLFDVAVDIRLNSPYYGKWISEELSSENKKQLWIPPGFAHGFLTLTDNTEFVYKCTNYYDPDDQNTIKWDDELLNIKWPKFKNLILSENDKNGKKFVYNFTYI